MNVPPHDVSAETDSESWQRVFLVSPDSTLLLGHTDALVKDLNMYTFVFFVCVRERVHTVPHLSGRNPGGT